MKKLIISLFTMLIFLTSFGFVASNQNNFLKDSITIVSDFDEGWEEGYCEGWKDVKGEFAICPIAPIAPIPPIGKDSYRGGYNMGFKAGMKAARKS